MLVLLDENLPHQMRHLLGQYDVRTAAYQGWSGLTNGALLKVAEEAGFAVMVTADKSLNYQQNLKDTRLGLVVLSTKRLEVIRTNIQRIIAAIEAAMPASSAFVDIGY